jgi:hypothetical protein
VLPALFNPILLLTVLVAGWGAWRVVRWLGSGGRLPLRERRGAASALFSAGLALQALYQPSARQALEAQQQAEADREDDDEGDPPEPGPH